MVNQGSGSATIDKDGNVSASSSTPTYLRPLFKLKPNDGTASFEVTLTDAVGTPHTFTLTQENGYQADLTALRPAPDAANGLTQATYSLRFEGRDAAGQVTVRGGGTMSIDSIGRTTTQQAPDQVPIPV